MRRKNLLIGVVLALLLVGLVAVGLPRPPAEEVARAHCVSQGWAEADLALTGFQWRGGLFTGDTETVDFVVKGADPPKRLRVTLHRAVFFLPWHVRDYQELPGE